MYEFVANWCFCIYVLVVTQASSEIIGVTARLFRSKKLHTKNCIRSFFISILHRVETE